MKILIFFLAIIILSSLSFADTSYPIPQNLVLGKGGQGEFQFQVQNIRGSYNIVCSYGVEKESEIEIEFPQETRINAGARTNVIGKVNVPRGIVYGEYPITFCVHCSPDSGEFGGGTVKQSDCGIPLKVTVAEGLEKEGFSGFLVYAIVGLILVISLTLFIIYRKRLK